MTNSRHRGLHALVGRSAILAAAKVTVAIAEAIRGAPGRQVDTVGRVVASPNTSNVIARQVFLTIDLRALDAARMARLQATFERLGSGSGAATDTTLEVALLRPCPCRPSP